MDFNYKDKTVVRRSYLYNGDPHTDKAISLYWDGPQKAHVLLHEFEGFVFFEDFIGYAWFLIELPWSYII